MKTQSTTYLFTGFIRKPNFWLILFCLLAPLNPAQSQDTSPSAAFGDNVRTSQHSLRDRLISLVNPELNQNSLLIWAGILICLSQSAALSGLNLAVYSLSRLHLETAAEKGDRNAARVLALRQNSNFTLAVILWSNVSVNVLLTLLADSVLVGLSAFFFSGADHAVRRNRTASLFFAPCTAHSGLAHTFIAFLPDFVVAAGLAIRKTTRCLDRPGRNTLATGA